MSELLQLSIYPVKSCAARDLAECEVQPRGLAGDRRWMIVDGEGRFVTGRKYPRSVLIRAEPHGADWQLQAPGQATLRLRTPPPDATRRSVGVWRSRLDAACAEPAADAWISQALGAPLHLVYMDTQARRAVDAAYGQPGDEVSFADGFPLLLISQASLDGLNARLQQRGLAPVTMARFRPNLVVSATAPHAEDGWRRIRIGGIEFDVVKPCSRCVFTTVDPVSGRFDAARQPLETLKTYRDTADGVMFGQNLIARGGGVLRVGEAVTVLA